MRSHNIPTTTEMPRASTSTAALAPGRRRSTSASSCCKEAACCTRDLVCCDKDDCIVTATCSPGPSSASPTTKTAVSGSECEECLQACDQVCTDVRCTKDDATCSECEDVQTDAIDEPISCDIAGCDLLEWDEKAVDELLRCCCGTTSHYQTFTTPQSGFVPSSSSSAKPLERFNGSSLGLTPPSAQLPLPASGRLSISAPAPAGPSNSDDHMTHLSTSMASQAPASNEAVQLTDVEPNVKVRVVQSTTHAEPVLSGSTMQLDQPVLPSEGQLSFSSAQLQHAHAHFHAHAHAHSHLAAFPSHPHSNTSPLPYHSPMTQFRCQWNACHAVFPTRTELVGHVNVEHLSSAPEEAGASDSVIPINGQVAFSLQGLYGPHQSQETPNTVDDHYLRCLWDSCQAALPVPQTFPNQVTPDAQSLYNGLTANVSGIPSFQSGAALNGIHTPASCPMSAEPTAALVQHLLQEHLHVPLSRSDPAHLQPIALPPPQMQYQGAHNPHSTHSHAKPRSSTMNTASFGSVASDSQASSLPNSPALSYGMQSEDAPTLATPQLSHLADALNVVARNMHGHQNNIGFDNSFSQHIHGVGSGSVQMDLNQAPAEAAYFGNAIDSLHVCQWGDCQQSFATTSALMDHLSSEHIGSGKSQYFCSWKGCERAIEGRCFNQRQKIVRHVRTHVGDKPCICEICGRGFSESTTLAQHMRTHTQEKPFQCTQCGKHFALASALTIHMRTHTGDKPFKCSYPGCDMSFSESSNLSKHYKTHQPTSMATVDSKKRPSSFASPERVTKLVRT